MPSWAAEWRLTNLKTSSIPSASSSFLEFQNIFVASYKFIRHSFRCLRKKAKLKLKLSNKFPKNSISMENQNIKCQENVRRLHSRRTRVEKSHGNFVINSNKRTGAQCSKKIFILYYLFIFPRIFLDLVRNLLKKKPERFSLEIVELNFDWRWYLLFITVKIKGNTTTLDIDELF